MSDEQRIKVTVDGPPVSADITLEQVRAYLTAKGWERGTLTHLGPPRERWTSQGEEAAR